MHIKKSIDHYKYSIVTIDLVVWIVSFFLAVWIRHLDQFPLISGWYWRALPLTVLVWFFSYRYFALYHRRNSTAGEIWNLLKANSLGLMVLMTFFFFFRGFSYSRIVIAIFVALLFFLNCLARQFFYLFIQNTLKSIKWKKQVLVLGCGQVGRLVVGRMVESATEYNVIGFLDDDEQLQYSYFKGVPYLGRVADLEVVLQRNRIDEVVLAFPSASKKIKREVIRICIKNDVKFMFVPEMFKIMIQDVSIDRIGNVPLIGIKGNNLTGFNYLFKRFFDILVSFLIIIAVSPILILTSIAIKLVSPGPVLYIQERIGYQKRPFRLLKFRSMHLNSDDVVHKEYVKEWIENSGKSIQKDGAATVHKLTNDPRIIPFVGNLIRKFSIDELPQLFNVLKGDMSLVGPRPCLEYEMENYKEWHKARFDALPGLTGLWQVSGRNKVTFNEMVRMDIKYLQHWTFSMDLLIILKTPFVVLFDKAY